MNSYPPFSSLIQKKIFGYDPEMSNRINVLHSVSYPKMQPYSSTFFLLYPLVIPTVIEGRCPVHGPFLFVRVDCDHHHFLGVPPRLGLAYTSLPPWHYYISSTHQVHSARDGCRLDTIMRWSTHTKNSPLNWCNVPVVLHPLL